jgi:ABC-2 type transport system ATP-binding protein
MDEADLYSDEIAIIDKGRIVKSGTASELKQSLRSEIIQVYSHDRIGGRVLKSIRDLAFVQGVIDNNSHLEIIVGDSETRLPLILDLLRGEGISLERICTAKPTLDDVFLNYAGAIPFKCREEEERGSKPVQA